MQKNSCKGRNVGQSYLPVKRLTNPAKTSTILEDKKVCGGYKPQKGKTDEIYRIYGTYNDGRQ